MKRYKRVGLWLRMFALSLLLCGVFSVVVMRVWEISHDAEARALYEAHAIHKTEAPEVTVAPVVEIPFFEAEPAILILSHSEEMRKDAPESIVEPAVLASSISVSFFEMENIEPEPPEIRDDTPIQPEAPEVWREDVPLRAELQQVLLDACGENGVDPLIMLGLIETESGFNEYIVSQSGDYGLCQLNHNYFDPNMTPEENLRAGVGLLGQHLKTYGNISAALTAYHWGHDNGTRGYANVVLGKAAAWGYGLDG